MIFKVLLVSLQVEFTVRKTGLNCLLTLKAIVISWFSAVTFIYVYLISGHRQMDGVDPQRCYYIISKTHQGMSQLIV